jgi:opacity protein-like surface antigen
MDLMSIHSVTLKMYNPFFMKKIIVTLAFVSTVFIASAQTTAGQMMLGGELQVYSNNYKTSNGSDNSYVEFSPSFGYFVSDNFVVGASVSLGSYKSGVAPGENKTSSIGVGPFARFYKFTSNDKFAFFGHAGINFGSQRSETGNVITDKTTAVAFRVAPGFAYFFNEHWAAELSIAGLQIENTNSDNNANDRTSVNFSLSSFSPSLGLRYHFGN